MDQYADFYPYLLVMLPSPKEDSPEQSGKG